MRNMKKFLALVLAMMMVFSMAVITTSAADEADYTEAALQLNALNVMKGDLSGDLMLDADVTRYQTALFFVQALTGKTDAAIWNAQKTSANFADVNEYGTAIDYAYGVGVVKGRGNGVFGFNDKILYKDMIVMAIRALGYETEDMSYPYGHILAAQKLELLDGIDNVNYEAALNRGETAQLIWNMLGTVVAEIDPLTDKVLYPDEIGLTETIAGDRVVIERVTLLEKSGLAGGKFNARIVDFTEADEDDEESVDTVSLTDVTYVKNNVTYELPEMELAAADFGITAETPKVSYLGLEVDVFYNTDAEEFAEDDYNDGDATIALVQYPEYTVVENVADANIKYVVVNDDPMDDKSYVSLGGTKFTNKNYEGELFLFNDEDGIWERQPQEAWATLAATFAYDTKDDCYVGCTVDHDDDPCDCALNTYGKVAYRVIEAEEEGEKATVEVLYTPYYFGQYVERELVSAATGSEEKFVIIGTLTNDLDTDVEGEDTYVTETLVDGNAVTKKVSKTKGEKALSVKVEGEEVKSGDFMFYSYNEVDNILTVAANCGTIETGRLTAYSNTKETVKISGTNYEFGFAGLYDALVAYDDVDTEAYVDALEAGKDNVQFLAVDGKIVWAAAYDGDADPGAYDFAIVSFEAKTMAKLLDTTVEKYNKKLVGGYYIDGGYVMAAVLDVTTGDWTLGKIAGVAAGYEASTKGATGAVEIEADKYYVTLNDGYNADTDVLEYDEIVDLATIVKYADIATLSNEKKAEKAAADRILATGPIFAVVEAEDGVYTIASASRVECFQPMDDKGTSDKADDVPNGTLTFNANGRTNAIKADPDTDVEAARVTTGENTVIVVIGKKTVELEGGGTKEVTAVEVRTGLQTDKKSLDEAKGDVQAITDATFYAADASLIVLTTTAKVGGWGQGASVASNETYYVAMPGYGVEYETEAEEDYTLTISGLFDLKTMEAADDIVITSDNMVDLKALAADLEIGAVFYMDEDGELALREVTYAQAIAEILADDDYVVANVTDWVDEESIAVDGICTTNDALTEINVKVLTLDLSDTATFDWADHDLGNLFIEVPYDADVDTYGDALSTEFDGTDYFGAELDLDDVVAEITEPTYGIFSKFEMAVALGEDVGEVILAADTVDGEDEVTAVIGLTLEYVAQYDEEAETLNLIVIKTVVGTEADGE